MILETLKRTRYSSFMNRVHGEIVNAYWDVAEDSAAVAVPGKLVRVFGEIVGHHEVDKALRLAWELWQKHSFISNIFSNVSANAPQNEILDVASYIASSRVARTLVFDVSGYPSISLVELAKRCPQENRRRLLSVLDSSDHLAKIMSSAAGEYIAGFYQHIFDGTDDAQAIARLKASPSWNSIDHRNRIFVEWLDEKDSRLLAALR